MCPFRVSACPTSLEWSSDRPLLPRLIINGDFQKWQQCLEYIQECSHLSWACRSDLALSFVPRSILSCVAAVASFVVLSLSCLSLSLVAATGYDRKRTGIILDCCNCLDSPKLQITCIFVNGVQDKDSGVVCQWGGSKADYNITFDSFCWKTGLQHNIPEVSQTRYKILNRQPAHLSVVQSSFLQDDAELLCIKFKLRWAAEVMWSSAFYLDNMALILVTCF